MLNTNSVHRNLIAQLFSSAVDDVVKDHYTRLSQEHQITSKIADRIEQVANNWSVGSYQISARAQDLPDKGRGSLEKPTGTDLFIGLRLENVRENYLVEKGLLIQSKKANKINSTTHKALVEQCRTMLDKSKDGSFVWVYDDFGTSVVPAGELVENPNVDVRKLSSKNTSEFFRDTLDCFIGDRGLIFGEIFDSNEDLNGFLKELAINNGVALNIVARD